MSINNNFLSKITFDVKSTMFLSFSDFGPIEFIHIITGISIIGNVIFGTVWCVYFLFCIKVLRKKVYYLKKQTDERCLEELKNAKVDYIKSIFIAAISAFEVLLHLSIVWGGLSLQYLKRPNCTGGIYYIEYVYQYPVARPILAFFVTSTIMFVSLIHILTSYLSHAYSEKRITNIMRRERVMFAWLFIQLVCVWCSIFYWPLFMLTLPIMTVVALIGHLCLYWKYGRELYSVIRRRERDALFEDVHSHRKLSEMLKSYKKDAILYFVYILSFTIGIVVSIFSTLLQAIFLDDCLLRKYIHLNIHVLNGNRVLPEINNVVGNVTLMVGLVSLLLMYISIMCRIIVRLFKKRFAMYTPTRRFSNTLYRPLIGNN